MPKGFPLQWPTGWKRARERRRILPGRGRTGLFDSRARLLDELRLLGVEDHTIVISTNLQLRADGLPRADRSEVVEDPGVGVYFRLDDRPLSFGCDTYELVRDNMRAIALTIEALRGLQRWGASDMMDRAFRGFLALPEKASSPWREVLGFDSKARITLADVESRFKELSRKHHPDLNPGADDEPFRRLTEARSTARMEFESAARAM